MQNFKIKTPNRAALVPVTKDVATAIPEWRFIGKDWSNLAVTATAVSAKIAYAPFGAPTGQDFVLVFKNPEFVFEGTSTAVITQAMEGTFVDMSISSGNQLVNVGATTTQVFKVVDIRRQAIGTTKVLISIAKPL